MSPQMTHFEKVSFYSEVTFNEDNMKADLDILKFC